VGRIRRSLPAVGVQPRSDATQRDRTRPDATGRDRAQPSAVAGRYRAGERKGVAEGSLNEVGAGLGMPWYWAGSTQPKSDIGQ
jgi:hypothetical protein